MVAHGNLQPSPVSLPSPQQQLQMLSQFQIAMRGGAESQAPPTTSQGIPLPRVAGVSSGVTPGLMPQLVVNPAALQNQPVLLPMQTSQGTIMVPLTTVLAMQAVANQQQQQQQQQQSTGTNTSETTPTSTDQASAATVRQIDGLPPSPPASFRGCGPSGRKDGARVLETPPTDCEGASSSGIPPGVLKQLLRQQRRRRRRGKRGGVPVEVIVQLDGPGGGGKGGKGSKGVGEGEASSSDDDSEGYGDTSDEEEVDQVDDDPLGSGDDEPNSEDEEKDFDTEDTIACQWEKVYRVKARWKFQLKDGIMRMGGFEYVFHKANGEAEW
ncbi:TFIIA-alpha and beta-like factor [Geodia barretti]|uniref:TFIIA-alpha and beta-like factor n=1 Tax=Geodia barretti TaxID=519541 RepID=A0AA35XBZ4_GEOBA|nr:TFIIA-alpha and beta-like factor [Geodia barretti]